ncbi:MAG: PAS domain S-box protein [Thiohalocapsa sp.]
MQPPTATDHPIPDLSLCDQEPIHIPGSIQPRGVLLALVGEAQVVTQVSQNCGGLLLGPDDLLGQTLGSVLGPELAGAVRDAQGRWRDGPCQTVSFDWRAPGSDDAFSGSVYPSGDYLVLELELEMSTPDSMSEEAWLEHTLARFAGVRDETDLQAKLGAAVTALRQLIGYDRVMIYRFDADWHGEVVAEACADEMESFLGLHYPATDIPVQARRLYTINPTRVIADIYDKPSPLVPLHGGAGDTTLDLSLSQLRSVSPVHLEYLHNMGVRATLTASLMHDGALWGLIACHHQTPRVIPRRLRELVGWLAQDLATQVVLAEEINRRRRRVELKACRERVINAMRSGIRLADLITGPELADVLGAVDADGVALVRADGVFTGGVTPSAAQIPQIVEGLAALGSHEPGAMFITDCLSQELDWTAEITETAAGVLVQPLRGDLLMELIWFRGEQLRHVTWGGDPDKAVTPEDDVRLSPRKSFAAWRRTVQLHCLPWQSEELESARELAVLIDIEWRMIAEQALRESHLQLQSLLDNAPASMFMLDAQCRYLAINPPYEALFGVKNAHLVGKTPAQVLPPDAADPCLAKYRNVISSRVARTTEETVRATDGVTHTLLSTLFPLVDARGEAIGIGGISLDITKRRRAEGALKVALAKYRTLFEAFPLGITVCGPDGDVIESNPASQRMLGLRPAQHPQHQIVGPRWTMARPDGSPMPRGEHAAVRAVADGAAIHDQEMVLIKPDGERRWLSVTAASLPIQNLGSVVVYEDITERKQIQAARQAEAALRESERRFRIMADELPLVIWVHDATISLAFVNRTCLSYFGLPEEGLSGNHWRDLVHPDDREDYLAAFLADCGERKPFHGECRVRRADGEWRWLESFARPIFTPDGDFDGMVGTSLDISERKAADEALRNSHDELQRRAEQLGRLTSELTLAEQRERERLSKVLHDHLQQLLVGIVFGIDRLERRMGSKAVEGESQDALAGVKDLLDQAIDAARTLVADLSPPILHEGGLPEALEWLARTMRDNYGLNVDLSLGRDVSPNRDDVRRVVFESVREALFNVVKHAQVDTAEVDLSETESGQLRIIIQDYGDGFDSERLLDGGVGGTGCGVLAMRERLRFLGGLCTIESSLGKGTRVTLTAPLEAESELTGPLAGVDRSILEPPAAKSKSVESDSVRVRILLVDDHAMVRQGLSMLLSDEPDIEIVGEAQDGIEAIAQVERLNPEIVLMDYSMPRMDGQEATRRITRLWPSVRVIALSMYNEADRAAAMRAAGASAYVDKTAGTDALLAAIRKHASATAAESE